MHSAPAVIDFASRGSFFDVLKNKDIELPWGFESPRFTLLIDVARVSSALSSAPLLLPSMLTSATGHEVSAQPNAAHHTQGFEGALLLLGRIGPL